MRVFLFLWHFIKHSNTKEKFLIYWIWGATVLGIPILLHFEEAANIIASITGSVYLLSDLSRFIIIGLLVASTLMMMHYLYQNGLFDRQRYSIEIRNFCLLIALYFSAPLLLSFGIYFVFWHSSKAIEDQYYKLGLERKENLLREYIRQILFFSFLSFGGIALMYWVGVNKMGLSFDVGFLFVFIAILTVPHSLLMNQLYKVESN